MKRWLAAILAAMLALGGVFALAEELAIEAEPVEMTLVAPEEAEALWDDETPAEQEPMPDAAEAQIVDNAAPKRDPAAVKLDAKRFPDGKFRALVSEQIDTDGDGLLSGEEIDLAVILDVSEKGLTKLDGIQYLGKLEYLYCRKNKLTKLDVSGCPALKYLDCGENRLKSLTLGKKKALEVLDCGDNKLTKLDVSGCPALTDLNCGGNRLAKLGLKKNTALVRLNCRDNKFKSLDVSKNKALAELSCQGNPIGKFDIGKLPTGMRKLARREDLRGWNDKEHFWQEDERHFLALPATAKVYDGKTLLYKEGYSPGNKLKLKRKYYKKLSDAQYANFRNVATTGMGKRALYRGVNPLRSSNGRNKQAMEAVKAAKIRTVINMSDDPESVKKNKNYKDSYYATAAVWSKRMTTKFQSQSFREYIPSICRFMIENEGPYYVHCIWGRDRTGFMCALLECLMGASGKEVVRDYQVSYYNFNGVKVGSSASNYIAYNRIRYQLAQAFSVGSILDAKVDLSACAEKYLRKCGLSKEEIGQLKARLAADY